MLGPGAWSADARLFGRKHVQDSDAALRRKNDTGGIRSGRCDRAVWFEMILLVEDEESLRAVMKSYLQNQGYVMLDAADPPKRLRPRERHLSRRIFSLQM
jgi:hypothetical protein